MSSAPRRCPGDVGVVEGFTHVCAREWGNGFSPRAQPRSLGASVAHVFVATSINALSALGTASPVRTPPPSNCSSMPHVLRRRLQLFCRQPFWRSLPTVSGSRAARRAVAPVSSMKFVQRGRAEARRFIDETEGPALLGSAHVAPSGVPEAFCAGTAAGFAPACRALSRQLSPRWRIDWE